MNTQIEIEEKYYAGTDINSIKECIHSNGLKFVKKVYESDEYFTDLEGEFIENRTCLRIRKVGEDFLETTFKGKSNIKSSLYNKKESNIVSAPHDYMNYVDLFNGLGYYSYVVVKKSREYYSLSKNNLIYNVLIDSIEGVGEFIELEIISRESKKDLEDEFLKFVSCFSKLKLEKACIPYRDFVAESYYKTLNLEKTNKINIKRNLNDNQDEKIFSDLISKTGFEVILYDNLMNKPYGEYDLVVDNVKGEYIANGIKLQNLYQLLLIKLYAT